MPGSSSRRCWGRMAALPGQLERNVLGRRVRAAAAACRTAGRYRASRPTAVTEVEMATRTTIALEDDINGGPAEETLQFRLGTAEYEIDLNAKNARRFRAQMAPFIDHARKAGRRQRRPARPASAREHSADIRAWARAHDIPVSDRSGYGAFGSRPSGSIGRRPWFACIGKTLSGRHDTRTWCPCC
jgi:nucleoid-associated protein Lsr2